MFFSRYFKSLFLAQKEFKLTQQQMKQRKSNLFLPENLTSTFQKYFLFFTKVVLDAQQSYPVLSI